MGLTAERNVSPHIREHSVWVRQADVLVVQQAVSEEAPIVFVRGEACRFTWLQVFRTGLRSPRSRNLRFSFLDTVCVRHSH